MMTFTQVAPEFTYPTLFHGYGKCCEFEDEFQDMAIQGGRNCLSFNGFELMPLDELERRFDEAEFDLQDIETGDSYYSNATEYINDVFPRYDHGRYSVRDISRFKRLFSLIGTNTYYCNMNGIIAELYSLIMHRPYKYVDISGCSQGEYATLFCPADTDRTTINYIESQYFNTGNEYTDEFGTSYYIQSECTWNIETLKNTLADYAGIAAADVKLMQFDGYTRTPIYKEV